MSGLISADFLANMSETGIFALYSLENLCASRTDHFALALGKDVTMKYIVLPRLKRF